MSKVIEGYIKRGRDPIVKWDEMDLSKYPSTFETETVASLTPFFGSKHFDKLTKIEKKNLYYEFIKFNAEMFLHLEYHFSGSFKDSFNLEHLSPKMIKALDHLIEEEASHTEAFYKFLDRENINKNLYIMENPLLIKITEMLIKLSPVCVLITGAKNEAYTVGYSKLLRKEYGSWDKNSWAYVNYLHLLDEAHHVPFQIELYNEATEKMNIIEKSKAFIATIGFFLYMQFIMIFCAYKMLGRSMPDRTFVEKIIWMARLAKWTLMDFAPMYESRDKIKDLINKNEITFTGLHNLLYR